MQAHRAFRNSKSQPRSTALAIPRILCTIKGTKDLLERCFRDTLAMVANANYSKIIVTTVLTFERNFHRRTFRSVTHGVTNDIFDGAAQQFFNSRCCTTIRSNYPNGSIGAAGLKIRIINYLTQKRGQIHISSDSAISAALEARQSKQLPDHFIEILRLAFDSVQGSVCRRTGALTSQTQSYSQACQWRTQLVRNIAQQTLLRQHHGLKALCHYIETPSKLAKFVSPFNQILVHAGPEVSRR